MSVPVYQNSINYNKDTLTSQFRAAKLMLDCWIKSKIEVSKAASLTHSLKQS